MSKTPAPNLFSTHIRLKPNGLAEQLNVDEDFWHNVLSGKFGNFHHEYLITTFLFNESWPSWEIHPNGDEIVILLSGAANFILETPTGNQVVEVRNPGDYAFVPQGTWHTADPLAPTTMLFITAGEGTTNRARE
jgi:mannose-6-phosphate isomerase-like protein (cupin superfamily)